MASSGFNGVTELGQAHRTPREDQGIGQAVVALHFLLRHASGEDDADRRGQLAGERAQFFLFGPAAGEENRYFRPLRPHIGKGAQQQVQPLIGIERAEKAEDELSAETQRRRQSAVGCTESTKKSAVDGIGNHRDLVTRHAAGDHIGPQPLADRRDRVRAIERVGLDKPRRPVPQTGAAIVAMARRRVLPQGAHLVNRRDRMPPAGAQRRHRVEDGRMCVKDLGPHLADHLVEFAGSDR